MTPTEQDNELDEILKSIIESYAPYYKEQGLNINYSVFQSHKAKIKQLITADRKRVALEARIDEAKLIAQLFVGLPTKTMKRADLKDYLINRIAELKAQQEEVK